MLLVMLIGLHGRSHDNASHRDTTTTAATVGRRYWRDSFIEPITEHEPVHLPVERTAQIGRVKLADHIATDATTPRHRRRRRVAGGSGRTATAASDLGVIAVANR